MDKTKDQCHCKAVVFSSHTLQHPIFWLRLWHFKNLSLFFRLSYHRHPSAQNRSWNWKIWNSIGIHQKKGIQKSEVFKHQQVPVWFLRQQVSKRVSFWNVPNLGWKQRLSSTNARFLRKTPWIEKLVCPLILEY